MAFVGRIYLHLFQLRVWVDILLMGAWISLVFVIKTFFSKPWVLKLSISHSFCITFFYVNITVNVLQLLIFQIPCVLYFWSVFLSDFNISFCLSNVHFITIIVAYLINSRLFHLISVLFILFWMLFVSACN